MTQLPPGQSPHASRTNPNRRIFTAEEDNRLKSLVSELGEHKWEAVAKQMPNRTGRQCRERYNAYLSPTLTDTQWTEAQDQVLLRMVSSWGRSWARFAQAFPGKSPRNLQNRWLKLTSGSNRESGNAPHSGAPESGKQTGGKPAESQELMDLWGIDVTIPDEDDEERKRDQKELERCFPNHGGSYW